MLTRMIVLRGIIMKKNKKKIAYTVGCVALSLLLGFSSYIGLVIVGVVAEENKNGSAGLVQQNGNGSVGTGDVNVGGNAVTDNNGYVIDNGVNVPATDVNGSTVVGGNVSGNNNYSGNGNAQTNQISGGASTSQIKNTLLDTKKSAADIVEIYALVMNKAKAEKPGFTKIEYQELPGDPANRVISEGGENVNDDLVNRLLGFVEGLGVFVTREQAESEPYIHEKGDADMSRFPVFSREKGSYLTDPAGIKSYTYKVLSNGNVKFSFVLVSEDNPEPIAENSEIAPSYTGAVFSPMSKERIDGTVNHPIVTVFAKNIQYSLKYHDCYVEVEFNPQTLQIVNLKQFADVSIKGSGDVVGIGTIGLERQELFSTVLIKDLKW